MPLFTCTLKQRVLTELQRSLLAPQGPEAVVGSKTPCIVCVGHVWSLCSFPLCVRACLPPSSKFTVLSPFVLKAPGTFPHAHSHLLLQYQGPRHGSVSPDVTMASSGSTESLYLPIPHCMESPVHLPPVYKPLSITFSPNSPLHTPSFPSFHHLFSHYSGAHNGYLGVFLPDSP